MQKLEKKKKMNMFLQKSLEKFRQVYLVTFISYIFQCKVEKEIKRISIPINSTKDIFFLITKSVGT